MVSKKETLHGLTDVLTVCHERFGHALEDERKDLSTINQATKNAIELINRLDKELEFEKAFNSNLCEAIAKKREGYVESTTESGVQFGEWVSCRERLPKVGEDVILKFKDTFHTHPSWPKIQIMPAWRCNVDESQPNGEWAIEGRLWHQTIISIDDGIAWMPMPKGV